MISETIHWGGQAAGGACVSTGVECLGSFVPLLSALLPAAPHQPPAVARQDGLVVHDRQRDLDGHAQSVGLAIQAREKSAPGHRAVSNEVKTFAGVLAGRSVWGRELFWGKTRCRMRAYRSGAQGAAARTDSQTTYGLPVRFSGLRPRVGDRTRRWKSAASSETPTRLSW